MIPAPPLWKQMKRSTMCFSGVFCQVWMPWVRLLCATQWVKSQTPAVLPPGQWKPEAPVVPWTPTATQSRAMLPAPGPRKKPVIE